MPGGKFSCFLCAFYYKHFMSLTHRKNTRKLESERDSEEEKNKIEKDVAKPHAFTYPNGT